MMSVLQGPLGAALVLFVLIWLGMGVSVATLLRRAEVPGVRAYVASLLLWPLVLRRLRQLPRPWPDEDEGRPGGGQDDAPPG